MTTEWKGMCVHERQDEGRLSAFGHQMAPRERRRRGHLKTHTSIDLETLGAKPSLARLE